MRTPKEWLHSYKPRELELFDQGGRPPSETEPALMPKEEKRMKNVRRPMTRIRISHWFYTIGSNLNCRKEQISVRQWPLDSTLPKYSKGTCGLVGFNLKFNEIPTPLLMGLTSNKLKYYP